MRFGQETVLDGQQTFTLEEPVGAEAEEQLCKTLEAGKVVRQVVGVLAHWNDRRARGDILHIEMDEKFSLGWNSGEMGSDKWKIAVINLAYMSK